MQMFTLAKTATDQGGWKSTRMKPRGFWELYFSGMDYVGMLWPV